MDINFPYLRVTIIYYDTALVQHCLVADKVWFNKVVHRKLCYWVLWQMGLKYYIHCKGIKLSNTSRIF